MKEFENITFLFKINVCFSFVIKLSEINRIFFLHTLLLLQLLQPRRLGLLLEFGICWCRDFLALVREYQLQQHRRTKGVEFPNPFLSME